MKSRFCLNVFLRREIPSEESFSQEMSGTTSRQTSIRESRYFTHPGKPPSASSRTRDLCSRQHRSIGPNRKIHFQINRLVAPAADFPCSPENAALHAQFRALRAVYACPSDIIYLTYPHKRARIHRPGCALPVIVQQQLCALSRNIRRREHSTRARSVSRRKSLSNSIYRAFFSSTLRTHAHA